MTLQHVGVVQFGRISGCQPEGSWVQTPSPTQKKIYNYLHIKIFSAIFAV